MQNAEDLKAKGIDEIMCLSVNDAHVMKAWADALNVGDTVTMLADGNCEFTEAVGMSNDSSPGGMGIRSKRYSMIVDNGVVTTLNTEEPRQFETSSAEVMLGQL